jgi:hypothetical protein
LGLWRILCHDEVAFGIQADLGHQPAGFGGLFLIVVAMAQNSGYRRKIPRDELFEVGVALFIVAILLGLAVSAAFYIQYMQW